MNKNICVKVVDNSHFFVYNIENELHIGDVFVEGA